MKKLLLLIGFLIATSVMVAQDILLNDLEYFERQGVNVLVFSNSFNGGFNIEFLPSQYWLKTFLMDGRLNRFPRYATSQTITRPNNEKPRQFKGFKTYDDRGTGRFVDPLPLESGHRIVVATDDPERMISISSDDSELKLYDGRMLAQNGWFVLRSVLPAGKTGKVVTWTVEPHAIPNWIRQPNIGFSQIGYTPDQPKVAVIELDKNDKPLSSASLMRIKEDGSAEQAFTGVLKTWGPYYKYNYVKFDFSSVRQPGVYYIQYGQVKSNDFLIDAHVYDKITDATTDVWVPIHMNHMYVTEGYRTWHGEPFKEGYLQAPESDHFDLHRQGASTDTKYKPYELILQFIEHGVLNLVAQAEQIGHMASTLSNSVLDNYHHLGDAASITDGLHYDPSLKPYEVSADGKRSGTPDDMWAFTTCNPNLDLQAAGIFTSAARVLRGYNDELADRAQTQADRLRKEAELLLSSRNSRFPRNAQAEADDDWLTGTGDGTTQTAQSTQVSRRSRFHRDNRRPRSLWENLDRDVARNLQTALDSIPMKDDAYKQKHIYFPDIVSKDEVYRVANWLYGCHPYHNYSFVAVVGATRPKQVFYGNNRADFSAIPGNVAPGLLFRKPDHFENYDDWPFLWGQNEGTIAGNTQYIIFGSALKNIVNPNLTK